MSHILRQKFRYGQYKVISFAKEVFKTENLQRLLYFNEILLLKEKLVWFLLVSSTNIQHVIFFDALQYIVLITFMFYFRLLYVPVRLIYGRQLFRMFVCVCMIYLCMCMHVCIYVCIYVCMYICM